MSRAARVLFFDSGMGGLSVLRETAKLIPEASFYYLFDHEGFPYGKKTEEFLRQRVRYLLEQSIKVIQPDVIVIACNTASTTVLPVLREAIDTPIVGVVPAIKPAAEVSKKKSIALLATPGTVNRAYTDFLINEFAYDCKVMRIGSEELVRLAEEALLSACQAHMTFAQFCKDGCDMEWLRKILSPILTSPEDKRPDTVVLGCTHFPLVKEQIASILGPSITLIDSGEAVARRVRTLLDQAAEAVATSAAEAREGAAAAGSRVACTSIHVPGLKDEETLNAGAKVAVYTGSCSSDEKEKMLSTFKYFNFKDLISFEELTAEL